MHQGIQEAYKLDAMVEKQALRGALVTHLRAICHIGHTYVWTDRRTDGRIKYSVDVGLHVRFMID